MTSFPCPHCQAMNRPPARFCGSCGRLLAAPDSSPSLLLLDALAGLLLLPSLSNDQGEPESMAGPPGGAAAQVATEPTLAGATLAAVTEAPFFRPAPLPTRSPQVTAGLPLGPGDYELEVLTTRLS